MKERDILRDYFNIYKGYSWSVHSICKDTYVDLDSSNYDIKKQWRQNKTILFMSTPWLLLVLFVVSLFAK